MTKSWARRVQSNPRFKFTAKLYRNFTHARESLTEADEGAFKSGLAPLVEAGRLGALLLQFPYSFHNTDENRDYVRRLADQFREYPLVLEVRHASWDRARAAGAEAPLTAARIIEKHLDAAGGRERIAAVKTCTLKGLRGIALLPPAEEIVCTGPEMRCQRATALPGPLVCWESSPRRLTRRGAGRVSSS